MFEANAPSYTSTECPRVLYFPVGNDVDEQQILEAADIVYDQQDHAFNLNLSFGVILRNMETGEQRFFRPFYNDTVWTDICTYLGEGTYGLWL